VVCAIGVEAVVLRSWCVVLCTVCQLVSNSKFGEEIKTHFVFNNFYRKIKAVYEIMWKNTIERGRPQMTIWRMRIARWIPKATNTHSDYVILIALLQQKWLYESISMLRYTYIVCVVMPIYSTTFI